MTAIDFPNSPQVNDVFTVGERTWKWTGTAWDVVVTTQVVGPTGPQGAQGISGVISVTSPITNSGTSTSAQIGINQSALTISESQVTNLVSDLAAKLSSATAASTYEPIITAGTISQYWRGDKTWATFPTALSSFTNDSGYITSSALAPYLTSSNAASTYAPLNSPTFTGTVAGISKAMVGLGNVDNTTDANKPVSTATQTALNLKLDSSTAASTYALISHSHGNITNSGAIGSTSGLVAVTTASGVLTVAPTPSSAATQFLRGDLTWVVPTDTNTYPTEFAWTAGTTAGPTGSLTGTITTVSYPAIPSAGTGASGIVTTGAQNFDGIKTFNSFPQVASGTPSQALELVTKQYVDNIASGINAHDAVVAATTGALTATYNNNTNGIGATLTNSGAQSALVIDNVSLLSGDRVLVKNQATTLQNGIYVVTTVGTGSTNWVLTRASDYDQSIAGEVAAGDTTFVIAHSSQFSTTPTNQNTGWTMNSPGAIIIGSSAITFVQSSGTGTITAGTGISVTGNQVSINGTVVTTTDSRLSDARTPTVHASSHGSGGSDAVTLAQSQVTNLTTDLAAKANLAGGNSFTGAQSIIPASTTGNGIVITGIASQSGDLQRWNLNGGTNVTRIGSDGRLYSSVSVRVNGVTSPNNTGSILSIADSAAAIITPGSASLQPLIVRGAASQSANLQEWQQSDGTVKASVNNSGDIQGALAGFTFASFGSYRAYVDNVALRVYANNANAQAVIIKGVASQSANLQEWQDSSANILAKVESTGWLHVPALRVKNGLGAPTVSAQAYFEPQSATTIGALIRGTTSQSANLQEWQNDAGTVVGSISPVGAMNLTARLLITAQNSGSTALYLQAWNNSQAADLMVYRNSVATVMGGRNALAQIYTGSTSAPLVATGGATTAASGDGTTATITTTTAHGLAIGDLVTISGVTPTGYNGTFVLTGVATNTISYTNTTTGAQTVAGSVTVPAQTFITARSAGTTGLVVKSAGTVADIQRWLGSNGSLVAGINPYGTFYTLASANYFKSDNPGNFIFRTLGAVAQKEDAIQVTDNAGTVRGAFNSYGQLYTGPTIRTGPTYAITAASASTTTVATFTYNSAAQYVAVGQTATIAGFTTETYYNGSFVVTAVGGTSGAYTFTVSAQTATFTVGSATQFGTFLVPAQLSVTATSAATTGVVIRAATNQSADILQAQDSSGNVLSRIGSTGAVVSSLGGWFGQAAAFTNNILGVTATSATSVGIIVKANATQTADLQQWMNSAATVNLKVAANGDLNGNLVNGNYPVIYGTMVGHNPEGKLQVNPMLINDIAYARLRGSTFTWTGLTPNTSDIDAMFNASSSFWNVAAASWPASQVIEFTSPVTLTYGAFFGISFGNPGWAVRDITLEAFSEGVWKTVATTTSNASETFMGAIPSNAGVGTTKFRVTLATPLGSAVRITHIFAYNYASPLAKQIYLGRDGGTMYGDVTGASSTLGFAFGRFGSDTTYTDSTALKATAKDAASKALIVKAFTSQAANLTEWQDQNGTIQTLVNSSGGFTTNQRGTFGTTSLSGLAHLTVAQGNAGRVSFGVQNTQSSNTGDLVSYFNSSSAVVGGRNSNAQIYTGSTAPLTTAVGGATTAASGDGTTATITTTTAHYLSVGDLAVVAGITPTGYNGTYAITAVTTNTISYLNATTGSQTVAGTVSAPAQVSITTRSAGTTGLIIKGAASQAQPMLSLVDNSGNGIFGINTSGGILNNGLTVILLAANRNVQFASATASHGGGAGVLGIANATTVPTSNPTGGGILYVNSGALSYIGTSGSGQAIINADGTSPFAKLAGGNSFTGNQIIAPGAGSTPGLTINATTGTTGYPIEVLDGTGNRRFIVTEFGSTIIGGNTNFGGRLNVQPTNTTTIGQIIRGATSATADLLVYQNSSATILGGRNALGQIYTGSVSPIAGNTVTALTAASASSTTVATYTYGTVSTSNQVAVGQLVTITGFTAETYFNGTFAITAVGGSSGAWTFTVVGTGFTVASATVLGSYVLAAQTSITPYSLGTVGLVIKANSGQSVNLQEWQNSAGAILARVNNVGAFVTGSVAIIGANSNTPNSQLFVLGNTAANPVAVVKGAALQSANLQEWQDSSGVVKAGVNSAGRGFFNATASSSSAYLLVGGNNTTVAQQELQAAASQTADIARLLNSAGTVIGGRNANAQIFTGSTAPLTTAVGGATTAASGDGTTATITTTSNHYLAVGDRVTVAGITPAGYNGTFILTAVTANTVSYANATTGAQTVAGTVSVDAQASITARSAGTTGLIVKMAASQSSRAISVQNSSGTEQAYIDNNGGIGASYIQTGGAVTQLAGENSGGFLRLARETAIAANPGANVGKLYFRDGTNAGTLKLVVRAGASGVEESLFDNIDQTGTDTLTIGSTVQASGGTLTTASNGVGFLGLPQNATTTGSYTIVAADAGKHIYASATRTVTIDSNANLALPIGTTLTFIAGTGATMTIAITTDTMYLAGAGTTGSRTLAPFGMATAVKLTSTTWMISGNGLT
jgi:hypothetical protein